MRHHQLLSNNNRAVIEQFIKDFREVYGVDLKYNEKRIEVKIYRKGIFRDLQRYGKFSSFEWRVPLEIINGNSSLKKEWIKAFCDSESYVEKSGSHKRIVIYSANSIGLYQVKQMLKDLQIEGHITGPYDGAFRLRISGEQNLLKFHNNCNFYHSEKRARLAQMIEMS